MIDTVSSKEVVLTGDPVFLRAIFKEEPQDTTVKDTTTVSTVVLPKLEKSTIKVFPNPSSGSFTASFYLNQPDLISAALFDINGKRVQEVFTNEKFRSGEVSFNIENAALPDGIYFLKVNGERISGITRVGIY